MFEQPVTPRSADGEERVLPLINVILLLLIYFLLIGRISALDPINAVPPRSVSEGVLEPGAIQVVMDAKGRLAVNGEVVGERDLQAAIAHAVARAESPRIVLKADGRADAIQVIDAMKLIGGANVRALTLMTVQEMP